MELISKEIKVSPSQVGESLKMTLKHVHVCVCVCEDMLVSIGTLGLNH